MFSSAAGGAHWQIAIRCPSLPFPSVKVHQAAVLVRRFCFSMVAGCVDQNKRGGGGAVCQASVPLPPLRGCSRPRPRPSALEPFWNRRELPPLPHSPPPQTTASNRFELGPEASYTSLRPIQAHAAGRRARGRPPPRAGSPSSPSFRDSSPHHPREFGGGGVG